MLTLIRVAFVIVFAVAVMSGAEPGAGALTVALAALAFAGVVALLEMSCARSCTPYLSSIIYGALLGWIIAAVLLWTAESVPAARMYLEPSHEAAATAALMYLGAIGAVRGRASGYAAVRVRTKRKQKLTSATPASHPVRWLRLIFVIPVAACAAAFLLSARVAHDRIPTVLLLVLLFGGLAVDLIAGKRLPGMLPIAVPAVFFALAAASQTFTLVSLSACLTCYISLAAQQAALFVLWLYVGVAFLLQAYLTGNYVVPLVAFEE